MKRIFLSLTMLAAILHGKAQSPVDSSAFKSRKLQLEEVNLVSSYYSQNGDNSAVTGGIGTEKLTDLANVIDVKLITYDKKWRKHTLGAELGIDHYTSASSDRIDLKANSSASHADTRIYPSFTWSMENEKKGSTLGAGLSASAEFDYQSFGAYLSFAQKTRNRNGEFTAKVQTYLDRVKLVLPVELRPGGGGGGGGEEDDYASTPRNTFVGSLSYSQIVNQRLQLMFMADAIQQTGYLGLPFHRVYFADASVHQENLPDKRFKLPLGFRANYFAGDRVIVRTYYRFYKDNWGVLSHTAELELPIKITPFFSISPFYRYYTQSAADYFAPYREHTAADTYYTSSYDLSKFNSNFVGAGFRFVPEKGVFGNPHINMLEIRYGHYNRSNGLNSNIVSLNLKFK